MQFSPNNKLSLKDLQALLNRVDRLSKMITPGSCSGSSSPGANRPQRFLPFDVVPVYDGDTVTARMLGGTVTDAYGVWTVGTPGQWSNLGFLADFSRVYLNRAVDEEGATTGWNISATPAGDDSLLLAEYTMAPGSTQLRLIQQHIHGDLHLMSGAAVPFADQVCSDMVTEGGDVPGLVRAARYAGDGETAPQVVDGVLLLARPVVDPSGEPVSAVMRYNLASGTHSKGGSISGNTLNLYEATSPQFPGFVHDIQTYNPFSTACVDAAPRIEAGVIYVPDRQYIFDPTYFETSENGTVTLRAAVVNEAVEEVMNELVLEVEAHGLLATDGGTEYTDSIGRIGLDTTGNGSIDTVIAETTVKRA